MNDIKEVLDEKEFGSELNVKIPVLVDFYATWCGPCKMQSPILHEFSSELLGRVKVIKVDVDTCSALAMRYGIESIPTLAVFVNGQLKEKAIGLTAKAKLSDMLIKYL